MKIEFHVVRTCVVEVTYLRGRKGGSDGFWVIERCRAEQLEALSFLFADTIPPPERTAEMVLSFRDETGEGMSGRGCPVTTVYRDMDHAVFKVTANIKSARP